MEGGKFVLYTKERFFVLLQMEPGYKPHSVQGRECSGFPSLTDLGIIREGRTDQVLFVAGKGNVTIMMELLLSAVLRGL